MDWVVVGWVGAWVASLPEGRSVLASGGKVMLFEDFQLPVGEALLIVGGFGGGLTGEVALASVEDFEACGRVGAVYIVPESFVAGSELAP